MSWSLRIRGSVQSVREKSVAEFDRIAAMYDAYPNASGVSEANEVRGCKAAALVVLAEIEAAGEARLAPDTFSPKGYEVEVYGYGTHTVGYEAQVHLAVGRVKIE